MEFEDGRGYLEKWETGRRYTNGTESWKPLEGSPIEAPWSDEQEVFSAMKYQYIYGNYSCDCNKAMFLSRAYQQDDPDDTPCGDEMTLKCLTAIRPDDSEQLLWEASNVDLTSRASRGLS